MKTQHFEVKRTGTNATSESEYFVTDRVFLDISIIKRYDVEVLEDAATRGTLTFGLFGDAAPKGVAKFLDFVDGRVDQFAKSGGGPAYSSACFDKLQPGVQLEGGRIAGLQQTTFAGQKFLWMFI